MVFRYLILQVREFQHKSLGSCVLEYRVFAHLPLEVSVSSRKDFNVWSEYGNLSNLRKYPLVN